MLILRLIILMFIVMFQSVSFAEEKFPARWRQSMTNDPSTNYFLNKFGNQEKSARATVYKNWVLTHLLYAKCEGTKINTTLLEEYFRTAQIQLSADDKDKNEKLNISAEFNALDYEIVAHLCAGLEYMYGKNGVLLKNAFKSFGSGEPNYIYDSNNPYLKFNKMF